MTKDRKPLGLLALFAVSMILVSAVIAVNADAARSAGRTGGGGKHGGGTTNTGLCSVSPNPLAENAVGTLSGSHFPAQASLGFTIRSQSGDVAMGFAVADDTGSFSTSIQGWVGTNTVTVSGANTVATCTFDVV